MIQKFIEVTNGPNNWGKFMVARFDQEYSYRSRIANLPLLRAIGWDGDIIVFDLQTGEGAQFRPGGNAHYDLEKHQIWVRPLFEPFLCWLYKQQLDDLTALPHAIDLADAPFALAGYRRKGPEKA